MPLTLDNTAVPEALAQLLNRSFQHAEDHLEKRLAEQSKDLKADLKAFVRGEIQELRTELLDRIAVVEDRLGRRIDALIDDIEEVKAEIGIRTKKAEFVTLEKRVLALERKAGVRRR